MGLSARLTRAGAAAIPEAIESALADLGRHADIDRAYIIEMRGESLVNSHEWAAEGVRTVIDELQDMPARLLAPWHAEFERGRAVIIPSVDDLPPAQAEFQALLRQQGVRSMLMVPILRDGRLTGILGFDSVRRPRAFSDEEVALLRATADLLHAALDRQEAASRLQALTDQVPGVMYQYEQTPDGRARLTWTGGGDEWIAELDRHDVQAGGLEPLALVHPEDRPRVASSVRRATARGSDWSGEFRVVGREGTVHWLWARAAPEFRLDGSVLWHGYALEVSERRRTRQALERSEANLRALLRFTNAIIADDLDETFYQRLLDEAIELVDDAQAGSLLLRGEDERFHFVASRGFSLEELGSVSFAEDELGLKDPHRPARAHFSEANRALDPERHQQLSTAGEVEHIAISLVVPIRQAGRLKGTLTLDSFTDPGAFDDDAVASAEGLAAQAAVALQRFELEARLRAERARFEHLARHDPLTDLANRALFFEQFERIASMVDRHDVRAGLIFLDLDGFKHVNDTHGHAAGDAVLCEAARRLEAAVRAEDLVARLGGDEFAVLLAHVEHDEDVTAVAEKLEASLARPFSYDGATLRIQASLGTVVTPRDGTAPDELLARADRALYHAKAAGGGGVAAFGDLGHDAPASESGPA